MSLIPLGLPESYCSVSTVASVTRDGGLRIEANADLGDA